MRKVLLWRPALRCHKTAASDLGKLGDKDALMTQMSKLLRLDPHNPTVFDDCIIYARAVRLVGQTWSACWSRFGRIIRTTNLSMQTVTSTQARY